MHTFRKLCGLLIIIFTVNNLVIAQSETEFINEYNNLPSLASRFPVADITDNETFETGSSNNLQLAWGESYLTRSLIKMYISTGTISYLEDAWSRIEQILNQRDNIRGVDDYLGRSRPLWRSIDYQKGTSDDATRIIVENMPEGQKENFSYCWVVHTGKITLPIIEFAEVIYQDTRLNGNSTWTNRANISLQAVRQAVDSHINTQWNNIGSTQGYFNHELQAMTRYELPDTSPDNWNDPKTRTNLPYNMQNILGSVLIKLSEVYGVLGQTTTKEEYREYASRLANFYKAHLLNGANNTYVWRYYDDHNNFNTNFTIGEGEDISHASINVEFAILCYENGIVFTKDDMTKFSNTFLQNIWRSSDNSLNERVDGTADHDADGAANDFQNTYAVWALLSRYDSTIFTKCYAMHTGTSYYNTANMLRTFQIKNQDWHKDWKIAIGNFDGDSLNKDDLFLYDLSGLAQLAAMNELGKIKRYKTIGTNWSSYWDLYSGDFDGAGTPSDELFLYGGGNAILMAFNSDGTLKYSHTIGTNWSTNWQIYIGDYDGDNRDELFLYDNSSGNAQIIHFTATGWYEKTNTIATNWSSFWQLFPGNFDGDGTSGDELFLYGNGNAILMAFSSNGNLLYSHTIGTNWTTNWEIKPSDYDGDNRAELFLYDNSSGEAQIIHFTATGWYEKTNTIATNWSSFWQLFPGNFDGNGTSGDELFLYGNGNALLMAFNANGNLKYSHTIGTNWHTSWDVYVGDYNGDNRDNLLLFDHNLINGNKKIIHFNSSGYLGYDNSLNKQLAEADYADQTVIESPKQFFLEQNYSNPFNPETKIKYTIPKDTDVELRVFNTKGQQIAILVNEPKQAGSYTTTWNGENYPSGLYFCILKAGNDVQILKMTLIK